MKYTEEEKKQIYKIKEKTIDYCEKCNRGFTETEKECECLITFNFIKELVFSRIPESYWFLNYKKLKIKSSIKMLILEYNKNLNTAIQNNLGFVFYGSNGTGKTTTMLSVGMQAIIKQNKVIYIRMKEIMDNIFSEKEELKERLKQADIILLDEFDKLYHKSREWNIYNIDDFIRNNIDNRSILICTNFSGEEEIEKYYDSSVISKLKEHNKFLPYVGNDYRDELNKQWMERLKKKVDYMKLKKIAEKWNKNKIKKEKEEYDIIL